MKQWTGAAPAICDLCHQPITTAFVDGKVKGGGWALMCPRCHQRAGIGLGTGKGQQYHKQPNGWLKKD